MQAIITKYIPATSFKPSRIRASCERGSIVISYDSGLDDGEANRAACDALCARFDDEDAKKYGSNERNWSRPKSSGQIPDGRYVFTFIPKRTLQRPDSLVKAARAYLAQGTTSNRAALRAALEGKA